MRSEYAKQLARKRQAKNLYRYVMKDPQRLERLSSYARRRFQEEQLRVRLLSRGQ